MNKYSKQIAKYFYGHFLHVHESERQQKRCKSVLAVLQEKMGLFFFFNIFDSCYSYLTVNLYFDIKYIDMILNRCNVVVKKENIF